VRHPFASTCIDVQRGAALRGCRGRVLHRRRHRDRDLDGRQRLRGVGCDAIGKRSVALVPFCGYARLSPDGGALGAQMSQKAIETAALQLP